MEKKYTGGRRKAAEYAELKGIKALVVILGIHGGGAETAKWLHRHGATVSVTDERTSEELKRSMALFTPVERKAITFILGGQREKDFRSHDLIIAGAGVPRESVYLKAAREAGKRIVNDAALFFTHTTNPVIAVTGTRGKTTTTQWIAQLLAKKYPLVRASGNTPENALLKEFDRIDGKNIPAVTELSSWQLEYCNKGEQAAHIALITNIFPDHLNRYHGISDYASAKANIFLGQRGDDFCILNHDNPWTKFFLAKHPKSTVFFTSIKPLPRSRNGLFVRAEKLVFRFDGIEQELFSVKRFVRERGLHNLQNLLGAVLAVKLYDPAIRVTERDARALLAPRMRQEIIAKRGSLSIVNDSCATSPDGVEAAIRRFVAGGPVVLISGGTDKELQFDLLARTIKKYIPREQLVLLEGTATKKLVTELDLLHYGGKYGVPEQLETLPACVDTAIDLALRVSVLKGKTVTVLFSPGAASFGKFLHEFDRGEQFARLVQKH